MEVLDVIVGSVLSLGLTYTYVRCDRLLMPSHWRERGWNAASTGAAIFAFSPLCIVAHYWVTRRSFVGVLRGLGALVFLVVTQVALQLVQQEGGVLALVVVVCLQPLILVLVPWIALLCLL